MSQNEKASASLILRVLGKIGLRVLLVIASVASLSYAYIYSKQEENALEFIEQFTKSQTQREQNFFQSSTENLNFYNSMVVRVLDVNEGAKYQDKIGYSEIVSEKFKTQVNLNKKSQWREKDVKALIAISSSLLQTWQDLYVQIWIQLNDGSIIGVGQQEFVPPKEFMTIREPSWSFPWYDSKSDKLFIDHKMPIFVDAQNIGKVSIRIDLSKKLATLKENLPEGANGLIVNQVGDVIYRFNSSESHANNSRIVPKLELEGPVRNAINYVLMRNLTYDISRPSNLKMTVASSYMIGPKWFYLVLYPKGWMVRDQGLVMRWILISAFAYLLFELFVLGYALHQEVIEPIKKIKDGKIKPGDEELLLQDPIFEPICEAMNKVRNEIGDIEQQIAGVENRISNEVKRKYEVIGEAQKQLYIKLNSPAASGRSKVLENISSGLTFEIYPAIQRMEQALMQIKLKALGESSQSDSLDLYKKCLFIENEIQKTSRIVRGFLLFSQDTKKEDKQIVNIEKIMEIAFSLSVNRFKSAGVRLEVSEIPKVFLSCKMAQITQVVIGLLTNAFEAVEHLSDKWIRLNFKVFNGILYLEVIDSGNGIEPELRDKIFEPFFSTRTSFATSGLGLAEARTILRDHGGEISLATNALNTTFTMQVPLVNSEVSDD